MSEKKYKFEPTKREMKYIGAWSKIAADIFKTRGWMYSEGHIPEQPEIADSIIEQLHSWQKDTEATDTGRIRVQRTTRADLWGEKLRFKLLLDIDEHTAAEA